MQSSNKANIQCYHYKKFGHVKADCWYKNQRANFAAENEASENNGKGENKLFMTNIPSDQKIAKVWFIDSGCSNQMTSLKPVFKELNEGEKLKVELGNGKELQVEGKGTVGIETHHGNRILTNVQYGLDIGYNLLSVGQLMESGHSILFDDERKSEIFEKFKHFNAKVEKQSGMFVKSLRSDRGGEFLSNNFNHFCKERGIHRELITPYTPEQNGIAERKNRTVVEMARSMLQMKGLSNDFWAEAVSTSIYLLNISPTKIVMNKTPFEACWDWKSSEEYVSLVDGELTNDGEQTVVESSMETSTSTPPSSTPSTPQSYHSSSSNDETSDELPSQRFRSMEDIYNSSLFALMVSDPVCYDEAANKEEWQQVMKEEMKAIEKNGTWKIVDLLEGKNAIGLKWVYKTKFAADGTRFETVRIVLAFATQQQWPVYQFDVKSVFLNGELQEEVYVEQPKGFVKKDNEEKVYKLTKALYGLKQAPRAWYSKIDEYFQQNGFKRSANEPTLYVKKGDGGIFISQKKYAKDLLKKFGMINCKPATTPMNVNEKLQQNDGAEMADA
ncbi:Retrovirus-related Pol polyprotein from transposon TNT 1-94 [Cucumis melo var. makuwa]|uniref:Retrovirus-related Pol polyprotein from transposon TNT 1-94 n=1 Tax=Cucumis melo var. makuwa TaxID=1194695 RepID=A0A5D3DDC3_CUCMM|nr:Retrovirus-related Pol polyprotein from transposon TNT 1-94 [Cucumis melo var. makuwa]